MNKKKLFYGIAAILCVAIFFVPPHLFAWAWIMGGLATVCIGVALTE